MVTKKIFDFAVEALCHHNDGWSKKFFIERLKETEKTAKAQEKDFIQRILAKAEVS